MHSDDRNDSDADDESAVVREFKQEADFRLAVAIPAGIAFYFLLRYWGYANAFDCALVFGLVLAIGFHCNWKIGLGLTGFGLIFGLIDLAFIWLRNPPYALRDVLLLDPDGKWVYTGRLEFAYGLIICGLVTTLWGAIARRPQPTPKVKRNGAPYALESIAPDHVIITDAPHTSSTRNEVS